MREIRFRAWLPDENRFGITGDMYILSGFIAGLHIKGGIPPIKFLQYTGLKDKNGVEIYEGDIVRYFEHYENGSPVTCEVKWDSNNLLWGAYFEQTQRHHLTQSDSTGIEVIGNIYENPELMTPTNNTKEK